MIDLLATCEAYELETIAYICHIDREYNIADAMTRVDNNNALTEFKETGEIHCEVNQFIVRTPTDKGTSTKQQVVGM